jgi:hypothetical protein
MIRSVGVLLVGLATLVGASGDAAAWTKFRNQSSFNISTAHAYSATKGVLCGYSDGCPSNWHISGWWNLAPGQVATVEGHGWGNAYHQAYAFDGDGHEWSGGGESYGIPFDRAFSGCRYDFLTLPATQYRTFFKARGSRCCGGSCPGDGYVNFLN